METKLRGPERSSGGQKKDGLDEFTHGGGSKEFFYNGVILSVPGGKKNSDSFAKASKGEIYCHLGSSLRGSGEIGAT